MTVAILGRVKWDWGPGDVVVIRVDDRLFSQCEDADGEGASVDAEEIEPELAADLLTRKGIRLTEAGRKWIGEQKALWAKYELAERRIHDTTRES